jgi:spore maturation protein SpmB
MYLWLKKVVLALKLKQWLLEVWMIFWALVKIMVPILLVVRVIELLGWVEGLASLIEPIMVWVGLPGEMGLVWMSAMVSNIYTGMAVFYQLGGAEQLTVAQVSVLGTMILLAHALPMEVAIAKATGVSLWFTLTLRVGGALILGALLHIIYSHFSLLQTPIPILWQPELGGSDWISWFIAQFNMLLAALIIIACLTLFIRILRLLGVEKLIHWLLAPVLRALGIGTKATNIMIVGLTLGISFGGGLLIQEARSGKLPGKDVFMTMAFLGLSHSLIEDTLLILLLGADLSAVLWARLGFSLLVIAILARVLAILPKQKKHWLYRLPSQS